MNPPVAPPALEPGRLSLIPESLARSGPATRRLAKLGGALLGVVVLGVLAFAVFEPIQVLPRIRLAPGYALTNQSNDLITSEDARGSVVLYTFRPVDCPEPCYDLDATMAAIQAKVLTDVDLGEVDFRMITISLDPDRDTPSRLRAAAERAGAEPSTWQWATANPESIDTLIGAGFKAFFEESDDGFNFDPRFILVDGWGVVRGDYRYQTLAADSERIARHIGLLGEELRNSHGVASVAYEAAHLFLCYP